MARLRPLPASLEEGEPLPPLEDRPAGAAGDWLDTTYRQARPGLIRHAARYSRDECPEDVVQDVFTRLAAHREREAPSISAPVAYLAKAVRNIVRDKARSARRARQNDHEPLDADRLAAGDPVAALEARDHLARIDAALSRLKPLTREIFLARRLDGYSYSEIAERTGLSVKGVEKQMSRAIRQLGHHLRRDA